MTPQITAAAVRRKQAFETAGFFFIAGLIVAFIGFQLYYFISTLIGN